MLELIDLGAGPEQRVPSLGWCPARRPWHAGAEISVLDVARTAFGRVRDQRGRAGSTTGSADANLPQRRWHRTILSSPTNQPGRAGLKACRSVAQITRWAVLRKLTSGDSWRVLAIYAHYQRCPRWA